MEKIFLFQFFIVNINLCKLTLRNIVAYTKRQFLLAQYKHIIANSKNEQHPETKYKRLEAYYINMAYSLVLVFREHNEPRWELRTPERLSIDVSLVPLPLPLWDICSSCPLVLLSAGQSVCVCTIVEVGLARRLVWGVLWHLPLWRGPARTLVGHHIYQWLIVTSRSPWKHNRDLWPLFSTNTARWSQ